MKIDSITINFLNINKISFKSNENKPIAKALAFDEFVKMTKIDKNVWDERRLKRIYYETFQEVMKINKILNPVIEDIAYEIPKIVVSEDDFYGTLALYSVANNTIVVSSNAIKDDWYIIAEKDNNGKVKNIFDFVSDKDIPFILPKLSRKYKNITTIKFNDKEKELYLKTIFAHELRHFIQEHLVMSTKGAKDKYKEANDETYKYVYKAALELEKAINEYNKIAQETGEPLEEYYDPSKEVENEFRYSRNYKPKKILDENITIRYSAADNDNRRLSVKNHFLASFLDRMNQGEFLNNETLTQKRKEYLGSPEEVDAYNFQRDYFMITEANFEGVRKEVVSTLYTSLTNNAKEAEKAMLNSGMNFIEK